MVEVAYSGVIRALDAASAVSSIFAPILLMAVIQAIMIKAIIMADLFADPE